MKSLIETDESCTLFAVSNFPITYRVAPQPPWFFFGFSHKWRLEEARFSVVTFSGVVP